MKRVSLPLMIAWTVVATSATLPCVATVSSPSPSGGPRVLAFVSSDACEWCKLLERRVFANAAWREWAAGHVTFTRVDLPRGDGVLAPDVRERNNALADRLGVKGIPTFVVMAPDGETELGRVKVPDSARGLGRDMTPEAFIAALEEVARQRDPPGSGRDKRDHPGGRAGAHPSRWSRGSATLPAWRIWRFIPVVALLGLAAYLLVDKSKLPLALRGLKKVLGTAAPPASSAPHVPVWKRLLAFVLILIAFFLAIV